VVHERGALEGEIGHHLSGVGNLPFEVLFRPESRKLGTEGNLV
jgi:hypothetical protein